MEHITLGCISCLHTDKSLLHSILCDEMSLSPDERKHQNKPTKENFINEAKFQLILSDFISLHPPEAVLKERLFLPTLHYHKLFVIVRERLEISSYIQGFIIFQYCSFLSQYF